MKPVIALVGRPNVGKSTLFNCLTKSRDALVADYPGLTRDRQYGDGHIEGFGFIVVDTGGMVGNESEMNTLMEEQAQLAIEEADVVLFLVDARAGFMAADQQLAKQLRRFNKPIRLIVNKVDGFDEFTVTSDFYALGFPDVSAITASQGKGVTKMMLPILEEIGSAEEDQESKAREGIHIAVIGRPNVGKSTLINRLLGEERVLAFDEPGTTRDSIAIPFEREGQKYQLIDTAGIRRRTKVHDIVEKFSVIKAFHAIEEAHVVLQVFDARQSISEQDITLLSKVLDSGRALILLVNKWDGLSDEQREKVKSDIERRLSFIDFAEIHFISALHGSGVGLILEKVNKAYESAMMDVSTSKLSNLLESAVKMHQPPLIRGRRIKLRYAHQGGRNPPIIVIHGNQTERLPDSYKRYLSHYFVEHLKLKGTPVKIQLKSSDNPFKGRYKKLTPFQEFKKKREERKRGKS